MSRMDRETLLKRAGIGAGVMALPAAFGVPAAFGLPPSGQRFYAAVSFSGAVDESEDIDNPRLALNICGNFKPDAGWIKGGGNWILLDWDGDFGTGAVISSGLWRPTELVNYQTGFGPLANPGGIAGLIQASIVDLLADFEGLAQNAPMKLICNIRPAGISTGQPEGWKATIPGFTEFVPLSGLGITHTSVEGVKV